MKSKVKLKHNKRGVITELTFSHAQELLRVNKNFEVESNNYEFINNELIKRPSKKGGTKSKKSKPDNGGEELPK